MRFEIDASGQDQFQIALVGYAERMALATVRGVTEVLEQVQAQTRNMLSLGWHKAGTPTGSVPPWPPWRVSGGLSRSVLVEPAHATELGKWEGRVGPTVVYARIHELSGWTGRNHATFLPRRPYLKPAWAIVAPTVQATFYRHWLAAQRQRP